MQLHFVTVYSVDHRPVKECQDLGICAQSYSRTLLAARTAPKEPPALAVKPALKTQRAFPGGGEPDD